MATETRQLRTLNVGACPLPANTYLNTPISRASTFTRNNCASGQTGSTWTINIPAGAYTSNVSQADADSQANASANSSDTQANANLYGSCIDTTLYVLGPYSTKMEACGVGGQGAPAYINGSNVLQVGEEIRWQNTNALLPGGWYNAGGTVFGVIGSGGYIYAVESC